jgi:hypothetical protein
LTLLLLLPLDEDAATPTAASCQPTALASALALFQVRIPDHRQELLGRHVGAGRALEELAKVIKPKASRDRSSETFLVGLRLKPI